MNVVSGAASGVANYVSEGLFGDDDDQPATQQPATTEGSWLLGGIISNILNGGKLHQSYDMIRIIEINHLFRRNFDRASANSYNDNYYDNNRIVLAWRDCVRHFR